LPIRIVSSLFIGSSHAGCNADALNAAGITHVTIEIVLLLHLLFLALN